jgi:hypothetical protein
VLFFRDAFGLPVLLLRGVLSDGRSGIGPHALKWWREPLLGGLWPWPSVFGLLLANLVFGYGCKMLCTRLIAHRGGGSLHTMLVLTLQKFVAFVVSVLRQPPPRQVENPIKVGLDERAGVAAGSLSRSRCCTAAHLPDPLGAPPVSKYQSVWLPLFFPLQTSTHSR